MSVTSKVESLGGEAMKDASKVARDAVGSIQEGASSALDYTKQNYHDLIDAVKENPLTAILVAGAVGWLLASCSSGKNKS